MPVESTAYAALNATEPLVPIKYHIRDPQGDDVLIEVKFCGVCHSDVHAARAEWGKTAYPLVPGHEFTGIVTKIGEKVTKFNVGDRVAVGCRVNTCRTCKECTNDYEAYCTKAVRTYNGVDHNGKPTWGGYGRFTVVPEHFVFKVPDQIPMDKGAPLLCAGITMWSPIVYNKLDQCQGKRCAVLGLGGLGHMAVLFLAKLGHHVTVISQSPKKADLAKELGATGFIVSKDDTAMEKAARSFDYIFDTVSAEKPVGAYVNLLDVEGVLIMVGLPPASAQLILPANPLIMGRRSIQGSVIGSVKETQEMLEWCAKANVLPFIELADCDQINTCYDRMLSSDVKFRFVLRVSETYPNETVLELPY